jgi:hypothetical protein
VRVPGDRAGGLYREALLQTLLLSFNTPSRWDRFTPALQASSPVLNPSVLSPVRLSGARPCAPTLQVPNLPCPPLLVANTRANKDSRLYGLVEGYSSRPKPAL